MIHLGAITVNFTLNFGHVSADVLSTEMVRGTVMRPVLEIQRLGKLVRGGSATLSLISGELEYQKKGGERLASLL